MTYPEGATNMERHRSNVGTLITISLTFLIFCCDMVFIMAWDPRIASSALAFAGSVINLVLIVLLLFAMYKEVHSAVYRLISVLFFLRAGININTISQRWTPYFLPALMALILNLVFGFAYLLPMNVSYMALARPINIRPKRPLAPPLAYVPSPMMAYPHAISQSLAPPLYTYSR